MHIPTFMRRLTAVAAATSVALLLAACGAPSAIQTVDAAAFAAQVSTPGVTVIDVRTPAEFAAGHIAGAINIDVEGSDFNSGIASLDMSKTYAVYCHSGRRSLIAANAMADAGFTAIYNLDGGIGAWTAAGNQLVTG